MDKDQKYLLGLLKQELMMNIEAMLDSIHFTLNALKCEDLLKYKKQSPTPIARDVLTHLV